MPEKQVIYSVSFFPLRHSPAHSLPAAEVHFQNYLQALTHFLLQAKERSSATLIQKEGKTTLYITRPRYVLCSHPQGETAILLLVNLHMGSPIKGSGRTCGFFSWSVQTLDCQLGKCITKADPFVHFACDSHQLEKNSWKQKFKEKAHTKTIYQKHQHFRYGISESYFSIQY